MASISGLDNVSVVVEPLHGTKSGRQGGPRDARGLPLWIATAGQGLPPGQPTRHANTKQYHPSIWVTTRPGGDQCSASSQ